MYESIFFPTLGFIPQSILLRHVFQNYKYLCVCKVKENRDTLSALKHLRIDEWMQDGLINSIFSPQESGLYCKFSDVENSQVASI